MSFSHHLCRTSFLAACIVISATSAMGQKVLDGVTFADHPGTLMVPLKEAASAIGWVVDYDAKNKTVTLNGKPVLVEDRLYDGTALVSIATLRGLGLQVDWDQSTLTATLQEKDNKIAIREGAKRVEIDKGEQMLQAFQGDRVVLATNVSTGRPGHDTPVGNFTAGPVKERMHYSHLYENAPMPWCVEVHGNVFIHGYGSVPRHPASHGCIRMPLNHGNPARYLYRWIDLGTPVTITGQWHGRKHRTQKPKLSASVKASA